MTAFLPVCPNHGETLEGLPNPIPSKGIGKCPISGVDFTYEIDTDQTELVTDNMGNITKKSKYIVEGDEG